MNYGSQVTQQTRAKQRDTRAHLSQLVHTAHTGKRAGLSEFRLHARQMLCPERHAEVVNRAARRLPLPLTALVLFEDSGRHLGVSHACHAAHVDVGRPCTRGSHLVTLFHLCIKLKTNMRPRFCLQNLMTDPESYDRSRIVHRSCLRSPYMLCTTVLSYCTTPFNEPHVHPSADCNRAR